MIGLEFMVESGVTTVPDAKWRSSEESFARFLAWLDSGKSSDGQAYLGLRRRLVAYFERKGCEGADDLADETLERVNRRLDESGQIAAETPGKYCYITAKFVFLEYLRSAKRKEQVVDGPELENLAGTDSNTDTEEKERIGRCLERCLTKLEGGDRDLIVEYYFGERRAKIDHRRNMARRLGITPNALAIRACRIRERLEHCIKNCLAS